MSSRDDANRGRRAPRAQAPTNRQQTSGWDIDPAEIDRYLSGRPTRAEEQASQQTRRSATADQLARLQSARSTADDVPTPARPADAYVSGRTETYSIADDDQTLDDGPEYDDGYDDEYAVDTWSESDGADDEWDDSYGDDTMVETAPARTTTVRPSSRVTSSRPVRQTSRRPAEPVYDDDDDDLYEDPYLSYEEDWDDDPIPPQPTRRTQARAPRTAPRISMPSALSESGLFTDRISQILLGLGLLSALVMCYIVYSKLSTVAPVVATHVSASGVLQNLKTRDVLWHLPLLAGMVWLMNMIIGWFIARYDTVTARIAAGSTLVIHLIAWIALIKYIWP